MKSVEIQYILRKLCEEYKISSAGILNLRDPAAELLKEKSAEIYKAGNKAIRSKYIFDTLQKRANPFFGREWARSIFCISLPFSAIPDLDLKIPVPEKASDCLLMASYAGKVDYHIYLKKILSELIDKISIKIKSEIKSEICVDTKAVPEKIIANFAGIGHIGFNNCLVSNASSTVFIGLAFLDIDLRTWRFPQDQIYHCAKCGKCLRLCPTGAISENGFDPSKCISYLTIEKKEPLTAEEKELIGNNIFGCDICISACPESEKASPLKIDRSWLLSLDEKEFKNIFRHSACLYAGLARLKRNAKASLKNMTI